MNSLKTTNYAGRTVYNVLGFIWIPWAIVMAMTGAWKEALAVSIVFALGLIDDLFGTSESKGFRGHLRALKKGKVTTGLMKLAGISLVALVYMISAYQEYLSWNANPFLGHSSYGMIRDELFDTMFLFITSGETTSLPKAIAIILIAAASIALTSNFINLMDLRPGRASKAFLMLAAIPVMTGLLGYILGFRIATPDSSPLLYLKEWGSYLLYSTFLLMAALWPILLTIIPDLREKAMLGDGGANAAGFLAGLLLVSSCSPMTLIIYFLLMLALNLASEKISYSQVIDNNRLLKKLDNIGRLKSGE